MRILHLCLSCFYIDGYNYQENVLPRIHKEDGHEVRIIASTETYVDNVHYGYVEPSEYETEYGVPIKRLPYVSFGSHFVSKKIRKYPHLYEEIEAFAPDVIMSHALSYWSVLDVIRYKKDHPEVKFYADTHTASYNSGKNWLALNVLHRGLYRYLIQKALPHLEKFFYTGDGERQFALENYKVPESSMELYPLGGMILSDEEYAEKRARRRAELNVADDEILLMHSGKLDALKRTEDLLQAFAAAPGLKAKFAIIGSIPEEMKPVLEPLMAADKRVLYLGWKTGAELQEYLCACDLYCQPGSGSATMQNALCCSCPILLYPHDTYIRIYEYGNIIWVKTVEDMARAFQGLADGTVDLTALQEGSVRCARELLDYRTLAARLYR